MIFGRLPDNHSINTNTLGPCLGRLDWIAARRIAGFSTPGFGKGQPFIVKTG